MSRIEEIRDRPASVRSALAVGDYRAALDAYQAEVERLEGDLAEMTREARLSRESTEKALARERDGTLLGYAIRDDLAARLDAVEALTYQSDDGTEYEHVLGCEGESNCPACWSAAIRRAARGES